MKKAMMSNPDHLDHAADAYEAFCRKWARHIGTTLLQEFMIDARQMSEVIAIELGLTAFDRFEASIQSMKKDKVN